MEYKFDEIIKTKHIIDIDFDCLLDRVLLDLESDFKNIDLDFDINDIDSEYLSAYLYDNIEDYIYELYDFDVQSADNYYVCEQIGNDFKDWLKNKFNNK